MSNLAWAYQNLFDDATITASSEAANMSASMLQQEDVDRQWRGTGGTSDSFTATWSSDQTADTFAIMGVGDRYDSIGFFLATGTVRLQLTSNGGSLGDMYDSTAQANIVDPNYRRAIHLLTSKTFRSAKWSWSQAGASFITAGRGFVGNRTTVAYNAALGAQRTMLDPSVRKLTEGGQSKVRQKVRRAVYDINLEWVTEAQRWSLIEAMDIACGAHEPLLMIFDPASTNLGRDTVYGFIDTKPVIIPGGFDSAGGMIHSRAYTIEERN